MARKDFQGGQLACSFCGKSQREVRKLIAGPTVYICDECIRLCTDIMHEETDAGLSPRKPRQIPKPADILNFLGDYIIGQERAKKTLAVAVYNHYKRIGKPSHAIENPVELQKSNVLLVGPTGTGKTLLAQTLARLLDVPFAVADATTLTEAGYVGEDVENIVANLLIASDNDVERAQRGIIYIDEIDKIARKGESLSLMRDVSGEGVQQALLKIIEGTRANVQPSGSKKYGQSEAVQIDTTNILVICGGSFTGIEQMIQNRLGKRSMGFGAEVRSRSDAGTGALLQFLEPEDLTKYGLIPEFVGRLPVVATLDDLSVVDLQHILTVPKNALVRQYKKLFELENVELTFDEQALEAVATKAAQNKSGARGLRAILEDSMLEIMYEVPFLEGIKRCHIHKEVILQKQAPELFFKTKKSA